MYFTQSQCETHYLRFWVRIRSVVAVVYYSLTGNTDAVARKIADTLGNQVKTERIRPTKRRSYPNWLLRSLVPGAKVDVHDVDVDTEKHDTVFLGTPKWSLSCPPFNGFVSEENLSGTRIGLFLTYGGFDEKRYARSLRNRIEQEGSEVPATLSVNSAAVDTERCSSAVQRFVEDALR